MIKEYEEYGKVITIRGRMDLTLITDSQDVKPLNERFESDFDGFFVKVEDGDYSEVYGFYGTVPYLWIRLFKVM